MNNPAHKEAARDMAKRTIVLLKNEPLLSGGAGVGLLPLNKDTKTIALIGPFIKAVRDNLGFWSYEYPDDSSTIVTQYDGIKKGLMQTLIYCMQKAVTSMILPLLALQMR